MTIQLKVVEQQFAVVMLLFFCTRWFELLNLWIYSLRFLLQRVVSPTVKMAARVSGGTYACAHEDIPVITVSMEW